MWAGMSGNWVGNSEDLSVQHHPTFFFNLISFFANRKHNKWEIIYHLKLVNSSRFWHRDTARDTIVKHTSTHTRTPGVIEFPVHLMFLLEETGESGGNPEQKLTEYTSQNWMWTWLCPAFQLFAQSPSASVNPGPGCLIRVVGGDWGCDPVEGTLS